MYVNGAPELVLGWTTLSKEKKEEVLATINHLTEQGKRLIGFARKDTPISKQHLDGSDAMGDLTWGGRYPHGRYYRRLCKNFGVCFGPAGNKGW